MILIEKFYQELRAINLAKFQGVSLQLNPAGGQVFFTVLGNNNHKCYDNAPDNGQRIAIVAPLCS